MFPARVSAAASACSSPPALDLQRLQETECMCAALVTLLAPPSLSVLMSAAVSSSLPVNLPVCVEPLLSTCVAPAKRQGGEEIRPRPAKALMGGTAGPARSWGC